MSQEPFIYVAYFIGLVIGYWGCRLGFLPFPWSEKPRYRKRKRTILLSLLVTLLVCQSVWAAWYDYNPAGCTNDKGMYEQVLSRSTRSNYFRQKYASDPATCCHEASHDIDSQMSNSLGLPLFTAFYVGGGKAVILHHPRISASDISACVPPQFKDGTYFQLYFVRQGQQLDEFPLYVLDEWSASCNGAQAANEIGCSDTGDRQMAQQFCHYADALVQAIQQRDPSYADMQALVEFVGWQKQRIGSICATPPAGQRARQQARENLAVEVNASGYCQSCQSCQGSSCQSCQSCPSNGWQPVTQPHPVVIQQPRPIQQPPTSGGDGYTGGIAAPTQVVKGEQGPPGPPGPPGAPGTPADNTEIVANLSAQTAALVALTQQITILAQKPAQATPPTAEQVAAAVPPIYVRANPNEPWTAVKPGQYLDLTLNKQPPAAKQ